MAIGDFGSNFGAGSSYAGPKSFSTAGMNASGPNAYGYTGNMGLTSGGGLNPQSGPTMNPSFWGTFGNLNQGALGQQQQYGNAGLWGTPSAMTQGFTQQQNLANLSAGTQRYLGQLQLQAALAPVQFAQQKFNTVWPTFQNFLNGGGFFGGNRGGYAGGTPTGTNIDQGPIYTGAQTNEAVNNARAYNDQSLRSQQSDYMNSAGGRGLGFGPNTQFGLQALADKNRAANVEAGFQIPWQTAQANAQYRQGGQIAQGNQNIAAFQAETQRINPLVGYLTSFGV